MGRPPFIEILRIILMKKLFTALLLAAATTLPSAAYTVDEIVSTTPTMLVEYIYADYAIGSIYDQDYYPYQRASGCVTLKKGSDDKHLIISGIGGTLDFEFELVNTRGTLTANGTQLQIDGRESSTGTSKGREGWYMITCQWDGINFDMYRDKHLVLNINKTANGFQFSEYGDYYGVFGYILLPTGTVEIPNNCGVVVDQINFTPFTDMNGTAHATMYQYDNEGTSDQLLGTASTNASSVSLYRVDEHQLSYPVKVDFNTTENTFSILNLNNVGWGVDDTQGGGYGSVIGRFAPVTGTIDRKAGTATINAAQPGMWEWGRYITQVTPTYEDWDWSRFYFTLTPFRKIDDVLKDINGQLNEPIVGTYRAVEGPFHNDTEVDFGWVTPEDRGKRRTYEGALMTFPPMTYCSVGNVFYATPNWLDTYHDTEIVAGADVTLDVDLDLDKLQWNPEEGVYLVGRTVTNANDDYVASYDIMLVKGWYDHIEQGDFAQDEILGHASAVTLCAGPDDANMVWKKNARAAGEELPGEHDYKFAKLISPAELGHTPDDGKYTAFIRANYTKESKLAPTFHSLQYLSTPIQTSVSDLVAEGEAPRVKVVAGGIEVTGTDYTVEITDIVGRSVYSGAPGSIALQNGTYIVRIGSYATKVAVR